MKELKVGATFMWHGQKLRVVASPSTVGDCSGCVYEHKAVCPSDCNEYACGELVRSDELNVVFKSMGVKPKNKTQKARIEELEDALQDACEYIKLLDKCGEDCYKCRFGRVLKGVRSGK